MKKLIFSALLVVGILANAGAAAPQARGRGTSMPAVNTAQSAAPVAARSAVRNAPVATQPTAARSAVSTRSAATPTVAARAATTQKVINTGTKIATATKNTAVSEECQNKYLGCMDAFCMLDNTSGGRCICSDRNAELNEVLDEIDALDQQSYQMATLGVEQIEMGENADAAIAKANAVADAQTVANISTKKTARKTLDLSLWNNVADFDLDDDIFSETGTAQININDKTGDALHRAAAEICIAQMPECGSDLSMLQLLYAQRIKSDCTAYENSLKQRKSESQNKLSAAQRALREAALEQLQAANKYDLGQCTIQFKKCMQTTAGCGDDFAGCASVSAMDNTNTTKSTSKGVKKYSIKGSATTIEIYASTYDTLLAKKPLCETVTKQCALVADKVWDTFLKEVAPTVKAAELIAEDNARQNCIGNISSCFQKACRDNIDPNDPDGSYDMCLTRPETMLNVCKIPLNACGINATSASLAENSQIWDFVLARLAAMRVDSCTKEVKECIQSEDRCGSDYTQCVGLDTDTIMRMCPYDKLVGCQQKYGDKDIRGEAVYDEIATMVQGVMLNIDNSMLAKCQAAANEAMIRVCGDTENCDELAIDDDIGTHSLDYKICEYDTTSGKLDVNNNACRTGVSQIMDSELGRGGSVKPFAGVLDGTIYWESVEIGEDGKLTTIDDYLAKIDGANMSNQQKERVKGELSLLQQSINNAIDTIESDPTVQFCMTGRDVQGMRDANGNMRKVSSRDKADTARFPELTKQMRTMIAMSALKKAKNNYYAKYNELNDKMLQDYATLGERVAEIQGENAKDARREIARVACVNMSDLASLPQSPEPPKSVVGQILGAAIIAASVIAIPFTGGLSAFAWAGAAAGTAGAGLTISTGVAALAAGTTLGATTLAASGGKGNSNGDGSTAQLELVGSKSINQWNYKETTTSTFEWETMNCHKCVRSQQCEVTKNPIFGNKYCKTWAEETENCSDIQF